MIGDTISQLSFIIVIMSVAYLLLDYFKSKQMSTKTKVKYKKESSITSCNRGHQYHNRRQDYQVKATARWHQSPIRHLPRVRKQRRYITPKIKHKITRVGNISHKVNRQIKYCNGMNMQNMQCLMTKNNRSSNANTLPKFDSDSFLIGIDNHSSKCISPVLSDFVGALKPSNGVLNGISGKLSVFGSGTVLWKWLDDEGNKHLISIKDCLYVPEAPMRLLSPQQWGQQAMKDSGSIKGTWCATYSNKCVLHWNNNSAHKTITYDPQSNVAIMRSAPGYGKFSSFSSVFHQMQGEKEKCIEKVYEFNKTKQNDELKSYVADTSLLHMQASDAVPPVPNDKIEANTDRAELMRWHHRLGHLSFRKLKLLAMMGFLPKRLARVPTPKCAGCIYATMTKQPWTNKRPSQSSIHPVKEPGACVSIDQMESSTPGFIGHMKGILTRHRYTVATVFVDHASRLSYVHLQKSTSSEDTIEAKRSFEAFARRHGVSIRHYHADNGRFADDLFMKKVREEQQTISFCGVNAHFQNGIAERRIRDLQEGGRKLLLHAKYRWKEAVTEHLWPYALKTYNDQANQLPDKADGSSKIERFTNVPISPSLKGFHTWGCPVFALDDALQGGKKINKWNTRARLGLYLGNSPRHARSVSLVLNLSTGHVSPQFHVQHDDFFETVHPDGNNPKTISNWQRLAGLINAMGAHLPRPYHANLEDAYQLAPIEDPNQPEQDEPPSNSTELPVLEGDAPTDTQTST